MSQMVRQKMPIAACRSTVYVAFYRFEGHVRSIAGTHLVLGTGELVRLAAPLAGTSAVQKPHAFSVGTGLLESCMTQKNLFKSSPA